MVRRAFSYFDRDSSGFLETRELGPALREMGYMSDAPTVVGVLKRFDTNGDRRLDLHEFNALVTELRRAAREEAHRTPPSDVVRRAFAQFDHDRSGALDVRELGAALCALGFEADGEVASVLMRRFDANHDRTLDLHEFAALAMELRRIAGGGDERGFEPRSDSRYERGDAGADGSAAFADVEAETLGHRDCGDEGHFQIVDVSAGHHQFGSAWRRTFARDIRGSEIERGTVIGEKRSVAAALILAENIGLGNELGVRGD